MILRPLLSAFLLSGIGVFALLAPALGLADESPATTTTTTTATSAAAIPVTPCASGK